MLIAAEAAHAGETGSEPFAYRPSYSWSGAYIGVQAGHGWGRTDYGITQNSPTLPDMPLDLSGGTVGSYVGYNLQHGPLVAGIEADFETAWLRSESAHDRFDNSTVKSGIDWMASVRGRLGYAFGNVMPYVAAGVTFAGVNFPYVLFGDDFTRDNQQTRIGWTAGAGLEYGFLSNLVVRGEYRYTDLGEEFRVPRFGTSFRPSNTSVMSHEIRAGLALKFGGEPAPSVDAALSFANVSPVNWAGLYAGASASFANSRSTYTGLAGITSYVPLSASATLPVVYGGYNFQFGRIVAGIEGDALLAKMDGGGALIDHLGVTHSDFQVVSQMSEAWSARGRLGFAFGSFLPYVTAGVASANYTHTIEAFGQQRAFDERFTSWTAGAGLEFALSDRLILRAEYRYTPYGQATNRHGVANTVDLTVEETRVGVAFKL